MAEDDGFWYEEELGRLSPRQRQLLGYYWGYGTIFPTAAYAHAAAKRGDRVAQRLLKETYERYIVAKLTS